jgi:PmbA protein
VIQYPVEEITIAGNMKDMLRQIVAWVTTRWSRHQETVPSCWKT